MHSQPHRSISRIQPVTGFLIATAVALTTLWPTPARADTATTKTIVRETGKPARLEGAAVAVTATVENVDYKARKLTLKNPEGSLLTVDVGPEIKRLDEVKKGDLLEIEYLESMAVSVHAPTDKVDAGNSAYSVMVRNPTEKPSGKIVDTETTTVTVASIDIEKRVAELVREDGSHFKLAIAPDVQRLDAVKKGDLVVVQYTRSVALKVHKPEGK